MMRSQHTLLDLCRISVVSNLERYPPAALGILDEYEWDSILQLRHRKSRPIKGKGGLDGSGRLNPAVSDKFMLEVEEMNPLLRHSIIADKLIWKDIVEYRFKKGGLQRPKALSYPWPVLIQNLQEAGEALNVCLLQQEGNQAAALQAVQFLEESPMDLILLKDSGIGKIVKKFLTKANGRLDFLDEPYVFSKGKDIRKTPRSTLQSILNTWMDMAATSGVKMKPDASSSPLRKERKDGDSGKTMATEDLSAARKCNSWRALYHTLKIHDEQRRCRQGERIRERRQRLDSVRPKIVKVRHASAKQDRILSSASFGSGYNPSAQAPKSNSKIQQLKMEAKVTSTRIRPPTKSSFGSTNRLKGKSFGAAVAFATTGKSPTRKRKAPPPTTKSVAIVGGKRIKVPDFRKSGSVDVKKRLDMLKKGQASFRR